MSSVMKYLIAAVTALAAVAVIAGVWILTRSQLPGDLNIRLRSDPFPLAVGPTTLMISVTRADGTPVEDAAVQVTGRMNHGGMLPLTAQARGSAGGEYRVPLVWPMVGQWTIEITVEHQASTTRDAFDVYVYPISPRSTRGAYRSAVENAAAVSANAEQEKWIILPQGSQALMQAGMGEEILPLEIRLNVQGQNTLVIRNDDIVDHSIGPFFVKAGETVKQRFTRPVEVQGTCSILPVSGISIIVEGEAEEVEG